MSVPEWFLFLYFKYWYFRSLKRFWDCDFNFVNVLELHQSMINDINKSFDLVFHFSFNQNKLWTIGDQTGLFYTTNPVFYTSGNRFVRRTGTFRNLWFFHLSRRTTVIQDLLVRLQFSLVPDNRTNVNVEACMMVYLNIQKIKKKWSIEIRLNSSVRTNPDTMRSWLDCKMSSNMWIFLNVMIYLITQNFY